MVPNEELVETIDSSDEWIRCRVGHRDPALGRPEETVPTMSIAARGKALADAGIAAAEHRRRDRRDRLALDADPGRRDRDRPQARHRQARRAFDISAGCAGFGYGLTLGQRTWSARARAEYVLVIGVERLSDLTDLDDRATAFLFGDGAGAVVVGPVRRAAASARSSGAPRATVRPISQDEDCATS